MLWNELVWWYDDTIWHDMIWYDMTWHNTTWHDMTWHDMTWHDMIWYDMIWYDMTWYDMIWYDMIWYDQIRSHTISQWLAVDDSHNSMADLNLVPSNHDNDRPSNMKCTKNVWHGYFGCITSRWLKFLRDSVVTYTIQFVSTTCHVLSWKFWVLRSVSLHSYESLSGRMIFVTVLCTRLSSARSHSVNTVMLNG